MAKKIEITINKKKISVVEDSFLLDALRAAGFNVPTLCHHRDLAPSGNCRLCICEVEQRGKRRQVKAGSGGCPF